MLNSNIRCIEMHKSFIFTDKGGKLNSNIRCIEIYLSESQL